MKERYKFETVEASVMLSYVYLVVRFALFSLQNAGKRGTLI